MSYRYSASLPRENPAHYMYAPFEGEALLSDYVHNREAWLAELPEEREFPLSSTTVLPPLSGGVERSDSLLRRCLAVAETDPDTARPWANFFLRKIETARGIRASYGASGLMRGEEDAGEDAYACVALLFLVMMRRIHNMPEQLLWLNGSLKTIDALIAQGGRELSPFGVACARRAVALELVAIRNAAEALRVACP